MGSQELRIRENPESVARYARLKELGRELFAETSVVKEDVLTWEDVKVARNFLSTGTQETNPTVWSVYWEHVIIAPKLGRMLATKAQEKGVGVDPNEVEFLLFLHDIGRLVLPGGYLRNDLIGDRLLHECGLPQEIISKLPSLVDLMSAAEKQTPAENYFRSLSPATRIINLADNMGKRDQDGLFSVPAFLKYLNTQEERYSQESPWPSTSWAILRRKDATSLQYDTIERTNRWLTESGVDFEKVRKELTDYGPKFVTVVPHDQVEDAGKILKERRFKTTQVAQNGFWSMVDSLHIGETGVLISDGDPIAGLSNQIVSTDQATVVIIGPENEIFTSYLLNSPPLSKTY